MTRNIFYDFHIHSCLSPCGDDDMTPNNIVGMAALKGLQAIALTDHNTSRNCPAAMEVAAQYGLTLIPGMELTTSEEVHAVCLFAKLKDALAFDSYVYERILNVNNKVDIFGHQSLMDADDNITGEEPKLLISATSISFDILTDLTADFHGIMIPAHIDKNANSLLANLGFVPPDSKFRTAELHDLSKFHEILKLNPYLKDCHIICDSDAHYLPDIHEPLYTIPVEENSPEAILDYLSPGYKA